MVTNFILVMKECTSYFNLCSHICKMEKLKVNIQYVILCEFKNYKNSKETRKFLVFVVKVSLLTAKSETGFQYFWQYVREMNPNQDTHQTSIKMLQENWWNAIHAKIFENYQLHNLTQLEKNRKSEQAGHLGSSNSKKNKKDRISTVISLLSR